MLLVVGAGGMGGGVTQSRGSSQDRWMCHREQAGEVSDGYAFLWERKVVRDARRRRGEGFASRA